MFQSQFCGRSSDSDATCIACADRESGKINTCATTESSPFSFLPGANVFGGYHFTGGLGGAQYTFKGAQISMPVSCSSNGAAVGTILVPLSPGPYTAVPATTGAYAPSTTYVPWSSFNSDTPFQGSVVAPNLCSGGPMWSSATTGCVRFTAEIIASSGQASAYILSYRFRYRVPSAFLTSNSSTFADGALSAGSTSISSASLFSVQSANTYAGYIVTSSRADAVRPGTTIVSHSGTTAIMSQTANVTADSLTFTVTRNPNCMGTDAALTACVGSSSAVLSPVYQMFPTPMFCQVDNPKNWKTSGNPGLGGPCESLTQDAGCTANDVKIAQLRNTGAARSCTVGELITLTLRATFVGTSQSRYNVAAYFAVDGGNANCGKCFPFNLSPVSLDDPNLVNVCTDAALNCSGPFRNLDVDSCGDLIQNERTLEDRQLEFVCRDSDSNGQADLQACLTWDNQGGDGTCQGIQSSGAGTTSKCNCEPVNIIGLNVCVGDQLQCRGDDRLVNTLPCQPVFSSRIKITASAVSTQFPPSAVLYGNMFFDFQTKTIRYAIQYFEQSSAYMPGNFSVASPIVVREDILFPCKTIARTECTTSGGTTTCTASFNNNQIPRLFHEGSYTIDTSISALTPDSSDCTQAPLTNITLHADVECFKKVPDLFYYCYYFFMFFYVFFFFFFFNFFFLFFLCRPSGPPILLRPSPTFGLVQKQHAELHRMVCTRFKLLCLRTDPFGSFLIAALLLEFCAEER